VRAALAELREIAHATPALLVASLFAWALLFGLDERFSVAGVCAWGSQQVQMAGLSALLSALVLNSPSRLLLSGCAMILAMMAPLLRTHVSHVWHRSLSERRVRSTLLFALAYALPWIVALAALAALAALLRASLFSHAEWALATAGSLALLWQFSPLKRRCLARCHVVLPLRAFGAAADLDSLRSGFVASFWCIGTCWALMLIPIAAARAHLMWMVAMSAVGFIDRTRRAR